MSSSEKQIICRGCGEAIPADSDNCHHCGTSVRGNSGAILALVVGGILFVASIADFALNDLSTQLLPYGFFGLIVAVVGAYVIYEKRQRIVDGTEDV